MFNHEGLEEKFLRVSLSTYENLSGRGEAVADFAETAIGLAERAGIPLRFTLERAFRLQRQKRGTKLTPRSWARARAELLAGAATYFFVFNEWGDGTGRRPDELTTFLLQMQAVNVYDVIAERVKDPSGLKKLEGARRPTPQTLSVAVNLRDSGVAASEENVASVVAAASRAFRAITGATGYIDIEDFGTAAGDVTAHERQTGRHWTAESDILRTKLRGVFWGNLLGPPHVEALGGLGRVEREAPCHLVLPLRLEGTDAATGAYLQLTPHPLEAATPEQKAALRSYLAPVLT